MAIIKERERVHILGIPVDRVSMAEAVKRTLECVSRGQRTGEGSPSRSMHIVTANPEMIMYAREEGELREALLGADLIVPDGIGVVWAARFSGRPVPERVAGIDLMYNLLMDAGEGSPLASAPRVYLLGGTRGVAKAAALTIRSHIPGVDIVGAHHGYFGPGEEGKLIAAINRAAPDFLFVGLGVPRQELWIRDNISQLRAGVLMGVGGSFDVLAGRKTRAPRWMREVGLEWLYRLIREPRRIRRMLALPKFAFLVIGRLLTGNTT